MGVVYVRDTSIGMGTRHFGFKVSVREPIELRAISSMVHRLQANPWPFIHVDRGIASSMFVGVLTQRTWLTWKRMEPLPEVIGTGPTTNQIDVRVVIDMALGPIRREWLRLIAIVLGLTQRGFLGGQIITTRS